MLLDTWDPEDAERTIEDDWLEDADGKEVLDKVCFYDGLFEVSASHFNSQSRPCFATRY